MRMYWTDLTLACSYLPNQVLMCELADLDLSVMVSLEQL
jgi:hypothetical protein